MNSLQKSDHSLHRTQVPNHAALRKCRWKCSFQKDYFCVILRMSLESHSEWQLIGLQKAIKFTPLYYQIWKCSSKWLSHWQTCNMSFKFFTTDPLLIHTIHTPSITSFGCRFLRSWEKHITFRGCENESVTIKM